MKRFLSLIAAIAALGLAATAYAQAGAEQATSPTAQPAAPATLPSTDPSPSASDLQSTSAVTSQSSTAAGPSSLAATRLAAIVPSGMSAQEACTGFKSVDECAATLHVSQNLSIPFTELKARVTGGQKLAAAIKELKPAAHVKAEVRRAQQQARSDTRASSG